MSSFLPSLSHVTPAFRTDNLIKCTNTQTYAQRIASIWHAGARPPQHQRESVMSVVEGVETAQSSDMLISHAADMLHPSAVPERGRKHNENSHDTLIKTHQYTYTYAHVLECTHQSTHIGITNKHKYAHAAQ